jgi:hypothetical protein
LSVVLPVAEWLASSDHTLLGAAYEDARDALQSEVGLTDADLESLTAS